MTSRNDGAEINTELVSHRLYKICLVWFWSFVVLATFSGVVAGKRSKGIFAHSTNEFIVENLETIRIVASISMWISFLVIGFVCYKISKSHNLGFFKANLSRVNINGNIFQWLEVTSLKFTINSPKVFGERSAKHGFNNWIEFVSDGKTYSYEFYLKTTVMEGSLLELIPNITTKDGAAGLMLQSKSS